MSDVLRRELGVVSGVGDNHDEVHHLFDADHSIMISVRQPQDFGGDASGAEDPVERLRTDGIVPADEVGDRLQELDNVCAFVVSGGGIDSCMILGPVK